MKRSFLRPRITGCWYSRRISKWNITHSALTALKMIVGMEDCHPLAVFFGSDQHVPLFQLSLIKMCFQKNE